MNTGRRPVLSLLALLALAATPSYAAGQAAGGSDDPIFGLARAFSSGDRAAYLAVYVPDIRPAESENLDFYAGKLGMKSLVLRIAGRTDDAAGNRTYFLQAYFSNETSVYIENWLAAAGPDGRSVVSRRTTSAFGPLYKLKIPGGESVRAERVEITHRDIRITFEKASVFRDNVPGAGTALIVLGRGLVHFSPSDDEEKHQLGLACGHGYLEGQLASVYLRGSPDYIAANVKVIKAEGIPDRPEFAAAARIFAADYPRSFTMEDPLSGDLLSFPPLGDEAVIEMSGPKLGDLAYIFSPFSDETINLRDRRKHRAVSIYTPSSGGEEGRLKRFSFGLRDACDIVSSDLRLEFRPAQAMLAARARVTVRSKTSGLSQVMLRLNSSLAITGIFDGKGRRLFHTVDRLGNLLFIHLAGPLEESETAVLDIRYKGRFLPPSPVTDNIAQTSLQGRMIFRPRFDTYLFTMAGDWYPGPPSNDFFTCHMRVSVPREYECVGIGLAEERAAGTVSPDEAPRSDDLRTFIFSSPAPVKCPAFMVGTLTRIARARSVIPLELFVSADFIDRRPAVFDSAGPIIEQFSRTFGPCPFDNLGVVMRLWPTAGGFSPPSFVVLNEVPLLAEGRRQAFRASPVALDEYDDFFLAHEIAHQWWGQGVAPATYRDQWLSEGLAQYAAMSFLRERHGPAAFREAVRKFSGWVGKKSFRGPVMLGARLSFSDPDAYQAIVYDKPALALFMLEDLIGPGAVASGLRTFFGKYKGGPARTSAFIKCMEEAAGRDLGRFFKGWFFSHDLPDGRTSWSAVRTGAGWELRLRVVQSAGDFEFPLHVRWIENGVERREVVKVDRPEMDFSWPTAGRPSRMKTDPDRMVPGRMR